jgi:glycine oxidase
MGGNQYDFIIVGQGLAGTTLSWQLHRRGFRVLMVDRENGNSSSRIAAGLITPVTGKRLARSWRLDAVYPAAIAFYRWVEDQTKTMLLQQRPSLRLFQDEAEREEYQRRAGNMLAGLVRSPGSPINTEWFDASLGGFEMPTAARLDAASYLDLSRQFFRQRNSYLAADLDLREDVKITANGVDLSSHRLKSRAIILCRGHDVASDPFFSAIKFNAAKGEILTLRIPELGEERIVHRGVWLAPLGKGVFRAGSTYEWDDLQPVPTVGGRAEIERRLKQFLRLTFEVIDHSAAVRPVIDAGFPVLGLHPAYPQVAYFNGLGSKGSLLAPFFAEQLAGCLVGERQPDPEVDVWKFLGVSR